jgi:uncharacterized protein YndB with AHSA1/START domain
MDQLITIASDPGSVFKALLNPMALSTWWGCTAVVDARVGGAWCAGWGQGADDLGHQMVLQAVISQLEPGHLLTLQLGEVVVSFTVAADPHGTAFTVGVHNGAAATPEEQQAALQSWLDSMASLKAWVEQQYPYQPPAAPAPSPAPVAAPQAAPKPAAAAPAQKAAAPAGQNPFAGLATANLGDVKVVDEGGFGVTDPNAVVKSWSKEQGFGYVTHSQLGDVSFDYNGCDFEPAIGDQVLLLVIGKRYDGKPKIKRVACPAKGSNIR